ncbi:hypothetical protein [Pseudomonas asplenii]|uniref:Uncharacterized protein n=1 Tax=Pseudomonas asplenii TaxID=53407 RepID=A0A1H6NHY1_9PSED|nr:hypothetical protein [Pseudomonas fuscovaginae]SEI14950.1 hypothetical protein SAMN05216581_2861 [Pseudomonas fuscovaginae]
MNKGEEGETTDSMTGALSAHLLGVGLAALAILVPTLIACLLLGRNFH